MLRAIGKLALASQITNRLDPAGQRFQEKTDPAVSAGPPEKQPVVGAIIHVKQSFHCRYPSKGSDE
jgi:hypothetical protein